MDTQSSNINSKPPGVWGVLFSSGGTVEQIYRFTRPHDFKQAASFGLS